MKELSYAVIVLATLALSTCSSSSTTRQVLKFGSTRQDYVMFSPNMQYFTRQLSVCSWVKKLRTDGDQYWIHYVTARNYHEIKITDDGYSRMFASWPPFDKRNQLGITPGRWYHYCECWSSSSGTADVYYNGVKVGNMTTDSGRRLQTGGVLVLGQYQYPYGRIYRFNSNPFGGELLKLNMFSKKFTAAEVEAMYQAGICSEAEKIHESYRRLTWESILQQTRHGNVQLVAKSCSLIEVENKLAITQRELEEVEGRLDNKETQLQEITSDLTETNSGFETIQSELQEVKSDLERELETVKEQLNRKETEISEMRQRAALTTEKLNQTQTELKNTKADLKVTLSDLTKTHTEFNITKADLEQRLNITQSELRRTQADLGVAQSGLTQTQTELNKTKADLGVTQSDLIETQTELKETKADLEQRLNKTQSDLRITKAESDLYKIRISETEIFSANMSRELENTKNKLDFTKTELGLAKTDLALTRSELNLTKTELNLTKTELNLTKEDVEKIETNLVETRKNLEASLNETRTDLDEMLDKQNQNKKRQEKTAQDLDMLRVQLEKTKNRLNQTLAGLEEQISDIPDCEVAAANVSSELAATKLELEKKEEELEKKEEELGKKEAELERLRGAMSGEDCLGETSCSHWDILYNHCYFNNVLTEEKFMSLNKVWEKLEYLKGVRMTRGLIEFLKNFHVIEEQCEV